MYRGFVVSGTIFYVTNKYFIRIRKIKDLTRPDFMLEHFQSALTFVTRCSRIESVISPFPHSFAPSSLPSQRPPKLHAESLWPARSSFHSFCGSASDLAERKLILDIRMAFVHRNQFGNILGSLQASRFS